MRDHERRFMWAVQALALAIEEQVRLVPWFADISDELVTDHEIAQRDFMASDAGARLGVEQREAIEALDAQIEVICNADDPELWTVESLRSALAWARVRELAKGVLRQMGWALSVPPVEGRNFVVGPDGVREVGFGPLDDPSES